MTNFRTVFLFLILLFSVSIINATELPESAYIQQLTIDPANPEIVYAATTSSGLYRLTDGNYWKNITPAGTDSAYYVARLLPGNPDILFASGEKTGLWFSSDQGDTWTSAGLKGISVVEMAIDPATPYRIFALTRDAIQRTKDGGHKTTNRHSGVYRTEDYRTAKWEHVLDYAKFTKNTGLCYEGRETWIYTRFQKIVINPHNPQEIWLGARWEGGYHRSTDGGDTWQNHWISGIFRRVDPIVFHPTNPNIVCVGTHHQGWFKTYNNGQSWVTLGRGLESEPRTPHYGAFLISGVTMNPQNPSEFYTGSDYSNWKTTDGGISWQELEPSLTCEFARTMAINPVDDNIIYAGTNVGVFRSTDRGQTWVPLNSGFPELPIKQQLTAKIDGQTYEFALTQKGPQIYRRPINNHAEWRSINWLLRTQADSMSFDAENETITLHTEDGPINSHNGGIRWDTPEIEYENHPSAIEEAPFTGDPQDPDLWTLAVEIQGDPFFADSLVLDFYKRPPYVSLQLVSTEYPTDGSTPLWEGNFSHHLKGTIQIPVVDIKPGTKYLLYSEVRDFQRNVLTGYIPVTALDDSTARIPVNTTNLLPALRIEKQHLQTAGE